MDNHFQLKKIMVCLDLTEMDESLIRFTSYIARMMGSDCIYFVHVAQSLDMPKELRSKYPNLLAPVDETLRKNIEYNVKEFFDTPQDCTVEIEVREGSATDKILKIARQKDIDLMVLGKKIGLPGEGVLPHKLARIASHSVLMVPEMLPRLMDRILIPVDFSKHSLLALQQAIKIKETSDIPMELSCLHIYRLPTGWHTTGKSQEEFSDIMREHAQIDYQKFIRKLPSQYHDIPCTFTLDQDGNSAQRIYRQAVKAQSDLIILGSKGKTAAATVLMGSNAERLAQYDKNIPLLIVKDKNENISFLEALFKI